MNEISVVIVGAGGMGNVHFQNYRHIDGVKVTAAVGRSPAAEQRAHEWGVVYAPTLRELPFHCDVADICLPTFLHKNSVLQSFSLGMQVICEKPLTLNRQDAEELFAEAEKCRLHLYTAQVLQFSQAVTYLRSVTSTGTYGKALSAHFRRLSACPAWTKDAWLFSKEKSGLLPYDLHIHDLDVIVSLFGIPQKVQYYTTGRTDISYPEHADFVYTYPGLTVTAEAAWYNASFPFTADWLIEFEQAVVANDGHRIMVYPAGKEPYTVSTDDDITVPTDINVPPVGWYYNELSAFIACIRENRDCSLVAKDQILSVLGLLEKISKI